jgi:phosphatidylglycerophosphate synthase
MRKLPIKYENPIDNFLYLPVPSQSKYLECLTPNHITTVSLAFGLLSIYCLYKNKFILSAVSFLMSYFYDCVDGFHARRLDMVTKFGDWYDHTTDIVVSIILTIMMLFKIKKYKITFVVSLIVLAIGLCLHMGCQQQFYGESDNESLNMLPVICKSEKSLHFTKLFGSGTIVTFYIIIILYLRFDN